MSNVTIPPSIPLFQLLHCRRSAGRPFRNTLFTEWLWTGWNFQSCLNTTANMSEQISFQVPAKTVDFLTPQEKKTGNLYPKNTLDQFKT